MSYEAIKEARRAAEARSGNVIEAVRLGLQMKKALESKKQQHRNERLVEDPSAFRTVDAA